MTTGLDGFLRSWDESYLRGLNGIEMFDPEITRRWSTQQRQFFVGAFYHVRGHFGEVLWRLGNAAPDARIKGIILDNIGDEFAGDGPSHEQLYLELARQVGCDLANEHVEEKFYLPFLRQYNQSQLRAIGDLDWRDVLIGFAVGERLDDLDYSALRSMFESFGLTGHHLTFFDAHAHAGHFGGLLQTAVEETWVADAQAVMRTFNRVRHFQIAMWRELSEAVCGYRPDGEESAEDAAPAPAAPERTQGAESTAGPRVVHYDAARSPRLRSKYADVVALDRGDPSHLDLQVDADLLRRIQDARHGTDWGGNVLVFGGNGFIGSHLVHRLLRESRVRRVHALVRGRGGRPARERILAAWARYDLDLGSVAADKLNVIEGSMCDRQFGLPREDYAALAHDVDTVFQCAGSTDYSPSYLELRSEWVLGLLGIVQFCCDRRVKQLCYFGSTIAHLYQDAQDFARPDSWWYSGYAQMKWVNQTILGHLAGLGFRAQVCEAPYVLGSTTAGKDPGFVYSFWRAIRMGAAMQLAWEGEFPDYVPVDIAVDATVQNALSASPLPVVRPVVPRHLRIEELAPLLNCRVVSWDDILKEVTKYATPAQLKLLPVDTPELIKKTNLEPIYPDGYDLARFPPTADLAQFYLKRLNIL